MPDWRQQETLTSRIVTERKSRMSNDVMKAVLNNKDADANQPDTSELSLEQIRALAEKEMKGEPVKQDAKPTTEKKDLSGRPVKAEEATAEEVDEDEEDDQPAKKFTVSI